MSKTLLIVEKSSDAVSVKRDAQGHYILEGVFTEFGVRNNNNRVYSANDFLQHVERLKPKMESNKWLGELDHPAGFEVTLKNVSHVIENLTYDEKTKQLRGRIKLLNTTNGKEAQALVDAGIPLHISSRAAGVVESNGNVKLKQLFTYDLVADPGFSNAVLNRVYESAGFDDAHVAFFDLSETVDTDFDEVDEIIKNTNNMNTNNMVTKDQMEAYTQDWKREFGKLKESVSKGDTSDIDRKLQKLDEMTKKMSSTITNLIAHNDHLADAINTSESKLDALSRNQALLEKYSDNEVFNAISELQEGLNALTETVSGLVKHNDYIVENVNKQEKYLDYVTEQVNKRFSYMDYLSEELSKTIQYADYLGENLNKTIEFADHIVEQVNEHHTKQENYLNYLAENLSKSIEFSEHIAEETEKTQKYANYLGENLSKSIEFSEHIAEETEKTQKYANYLGENVNNTIKFAEHIAEETEKTQKYANYVAENVNNTIKFAEHIAENTKKTHDYLNYMGRELNEQLSTNPKVVAESLDAKLESLLESVSSKKSTHEKLYGFTKQLTNLQVNKFNSLNQENHDKVVAAFEGLVFTNPREAQTFFESVLSGENDLPYIKNMPAKYRNIWNGLSEQRKNDIKSQAKLRVLETQDAINKFWGTRDFYVSERQQINNNNIQSLNENNSNEQVSDSMKSFIEQTRRRLNRF